MLDDWKFSTFIDLPLAGIGDKHIDIYIKDSAQRLVIKVENQCKANLTFDETLYGIGIRSVISTTNKYEGMYDFTAEDGIFSAKISLNLM
jgi:hypothetical protein